MHGSWPREAKLCREARHEGFAYHFGSHVDMAYGNFATWLFIVAQIHTEMAQGPTKMTHIPTNMAQDGSTRICVGHDHEMRKDLALDLCKQQLGIPLAGGVVTQRQLLCCLSREHP